MQPEAKVLFVDDEPHVLSALVRQLRRDFYVITACGPEAGLETMEKDGPFTVVVADMQMPGMDGVEFLHRVKQMQPDAVRIMLSGNADGNTMGRALSEASIFKFLAKPCEPGVLLATIREAVQRYEDQEAA